MVAHCARGLCKFLFVLFLIIFIAKLSIMCIVFYAITFTYPPICISKESRGRVWCHPEDGSSGVSNVQGTTLPSIKHCADQIAYNSGSMWTCLQGYRASCPALTMQIHFCMELMPHRSNVSSGFKIVPQN